MEATTPPSLDDDIGALRSYATTGETLDPLVAGRVVRELTERTAGLEHLQRLFRLASRVEQRVGDAVVCSCTWSYGRPGVRTGRPADCPVHAALPVDERPADEPTEADPYPDGLPEDLYVDIESTIHQHCGHDGQSDEANDWVTDLMAALTPLIVRALVGGRPAAPTRDEMIDALNQSIVEQGYGGTDIDPGDLLDALRPWFPYRGDGLDDERVTGAADAVVTLLSRPAAEPPTLAETIAAKAKEIDESGLLSPDPIHTHARCTCGHTLAEHSYWDKEDEHLTCNALCQCEGWASVGVAAEPNEEHGDGG